MDYIVEEESRGSAAGVFLAKDSLKDPHFGMGLSPISYKIHVLLGEDCVGEYTKYLRFNSILSLLRFAGIHVLKRQMSIPKASKKCFPEALRIHGNSGFLRVNTISTLTWDPERERKIEFDRSVSFMKWRFGTFPDTFVGYACYEDNRLLAYFICRYVVWKGSLFLLLVDYRYKEGYVKSIVEAACKLSKKSKALGVLTLSTYCEVDRHLKQKGFRRFGTNGKIVTNVKHGFSQEEIDNRKAVLVTFADSDADFFYGNEEWYKYE